MLGKRIINSNDAAAGGACTTNTNDYPTTNVAYYKMSSAADEKDTYNGTASNVNFNVQGKFGNAAEFNGSSSYINTTYTIPAISTYSLSLWFKTSITGIRQYLFADFNSSANTSSPRLTLAIAANNNFQFYLGDGTSNWTNSSASALSYLDDNWHNLVLVINGTSVKLYADGNTTPIADLTSTVSAGTAGTSPVSIGRIGDYSGLYFNGKIDQVRIFSSALSASQAASLSNEVYCVPTIVPTNNFTPITYTGNGSTQSTNSLLNQVGSVDFAPDFVWIKRRDNAIGNTNNLLFDSVRGAGKRLISNVPNSESPETDELTSFNSNGFTVGADASTNGSGGSIVAWNWKAGGAAVSNTDGTITSQVSANVDAGFSIISASFPQGGYANTFGHSLNSTPELIIYKPTSITLDWFIFSNYGGSLLGTNNVLRFTLAQAASDSLFVITNETFKVAATTPAHDFIAYAFHSVDGFSKIGSYIGSGATSQTIVTGFRPAFIMFKNTNAGNAWTIFDNKRNTTNPHSLALFPNSSQIEHNYQTAGISFDSNGFTLNTNTAEFNQSTYGYIFMAFAEEGYVPDDFFNDNSAVATYKFNGNALDDTINGNNGTASTVTYPTGKFDLAAEFNATNSYVATPNIIPTNNFTFSVWVNLDSFTSNLSMIYTARTNIFWYFAINTSGAIQIYNGANVFLSSSSLISTGQWYNITYTSSSTSGKKIYVNGSQVYTNSSTQDNQATTGSWQGFGKYSNNLLQFDGKMDQARIFNRVLSDAEVTALYNE
jgi:hypothetical protein